MFYATLRLFIYQPTLISFYKKIITVDEAKQDSFSDFWEAIGGKGKIATAEEGGDDNETEKSMRQVQFCSYFTKQILTLYRNTTSSENYLRY